MYKLKHFLIFSILLAILPVFYSCSKDDDGIGSNDIIGNWSGTVRQSNGKSQYLEIDFYQDKTGELTFSGPVTYAKAIFTYTRKGSEIICKGVYESNHDEDLNYELKIHYDSKLKRLYPRSQFIAFILTKEGNIVTDTEGNEIR